MKKNYILNLLLYALVSTSTIQAQVINGNFENVKPNFLPSNWGMNFVTPVSIDLETGENFSDNLSYTWCFPSMCYATTESKTGQYALEISNAFNETKNVVIPGRADIFSDETQDFPGWNFGVPMESGVNYTYLGLGFDYKFFPVGNDVAEAVLTIFSENEVIGTSKITISEASTQEFKYIYSGLEFTSNQTPTLMTISFSMAKEGSTPNFGSRLIIDDVRVGSAILATNKNELSQFSVYPTVTNNEITITKGSTISNGNYNFKIINTKGQTVKESNLNMQTGIENKIDVSQIATGFYLLKTETNSSSFVTKFVKK